MPARRAFSTAHDLYPRLIRKGQALLGATPGAWLVANDAAGVAQATEALTSGRLRLSYLCPWAETRAIPPESPLYQCGRLRLSARGAVLDRVDVSGPLRLGVFDRLSSSPG